MRNRRVAVYCIAEIISADPLHYRYFKIGVAGDPRTRLSTFQTGNPHRLSILLVHWYRSLADARAVERSAHSYLKTQAVRGEWFKFGDICPFEALSVAECGLSYHGEPNVYTDHVAPQYYPILLQSPYQGWGLQ